MSNEQEYYSTLYGTSVWIGRLVKAAVIIALAYVAWLMFT